MKHTTHSAILALLALFLLPAAASSEVVTETVPIRSRQIENFRIGSTQTLFGAAEFIGGLEFSSSNALLGAISSIRFRQDNTHFLAVFDTGHWAEGAIMRDTKGRLSGLSDLAVTSMMDTAGRSERIKWMMDAEGLALRDGEALVSFERAARIDAYPDPEFSKSGPVATIPFLIPQARLSDNRGLETLVVSPTDSPLDGTLITVSELSSDGRGNIAAAILDGPLKGLFGVVEKPPFAVTDGAFLPDGDLLLLERRFSFGAGIGMQIRRIKGSDIRPGAVIDGPVILSADMGYQIDNMEGLDVITLPSGETRMIIVSDDNHSILQRNLLLEFRLVE